MHNVEMVAAVVRNEGVGSQRPMTESAKALQKLAACCYCESDQAGAETVREM